MKNIDIEALAWEKMTGLIPVIVQDTNTLQVLMLGYMNKAALEKTIQEEKITFYSRSKQRLWTKGEVSGNFLQLIDITCDCDNDTLLILAKSTGNCCHLEKSTCFSESKKNHSLNALTNIIEQRYQKPLQNSYTSKLFSEGIKRIAQKVGEEGVEVALAAVASSSQEVINESADLIFHWLVLLRQCDVSLQQVMDELYERMGKLAV